MTGVDAMVAQRAGVLAQIALAELHLEFTEVRAPFNGVVVALKTTVGQYASALKPVFTLLDDDRWYVIANFPRNRPEQRAPRRGGADHRDDQPQPDL